MLRRAAPLLGVAGIALIAGLVTGGRYVSPEHHVAERFAQAWQHGDYPAMYRLLSDGARHRVSLERFIQAYREASIVATTRSLRIGRVADRSGHRVRIPVTVRTRIFGTVHGAVTLPFTDADGHAAVAWAPQLAFPGLSPGQTLTRRTRLPPRATILARTGEPLAEGADRSSSLSSAATSIVGSLGPIPDDKRTALRAAGVPSDALVGVSGLERDLQGELMGRPGGELLAGDRVLARSQPVAARPVRSTIDPKIEEAAVTALGDRFGGVTVLDPRNGEVLALAGVAYSALQPPGSTFKIITATGALQAGIVKLDDQFPVVDAAQLSGVRLENANGELCGGSFENAFAQSCNSVFAPLGAKLGAKRLVAEAERFGFNRRSPIAGAATPTIPPAGEIPDDLAVGSTAIGQGKVEATTLQMALVAGTIANRGVQVPPTLVVGRHRKPRRVTSAAIAAKVRDLMVGVVRNGTGTAAALSDTVVAGKTGTAELEDTTHDDDTGESDDDSTDDADEVPDTDAWFAAFAPAKSARVAVGVLVVRGGAGGDVAAPIARDALSAALSG